MTPRDLYERYASAVAFVAVKSSDGDHRIGSAFHVGEGVFLTARHVVEGQEVLEIGTTVRQRVEDPQGNVTILGRPGRYRSIGPTSARICSGPLYHPNPGVDVAALVTEGFEVPAIPLGSHLDDWLVHEDFVLRRVVVMGYPPIPFAKGPTLIASEAEVNTVVDKYTGGHPSFIVSATARGGFSGGPCLVEWDFALGLVTESLTTNHQAAELGYMAVTSVEPLFVCLQHHGIVPAIQKEGWDGL
jgi:hypothetical protein